MPKEKLVSIVIVNYNGQNLLKEILKSVERLQYRSKEILLVDNSSSDNSVEFVKRNFRHVKIIKNKINEGYSGINSAIRHCLGSYILFLNNDMELDRQCLKNMVNSIEKNEDIAMIAPKLVNFYERNLESAGTWASRSFYCGHLKGSRKDSEKEIPYMGIGLIRKDFVKKFGYLFDPDYFIYAEDLDLGIRIRLCGKRCVFAPNARIYHMHSVTAQKVLKSRTTYLMERNLMMTLIKTLSLKSVALFLPYALLMRIIACFKDIFTLRLDNFASRVKSILFILFNLGFVARKRRETQKFRSADDDYILKVFSEKYVFRKKFNV